MIHDLVELRVSSIYNPIQSLLHSVSLEFKDADRLSQIVDKGKASYDYTYSGYDMSKRYALAEWVSVTHSSVNDCLSMASIALIICEDLLFSFLDVDVVSADFSLDKSPVILEFLKYACLSRFMS